MRAALFALALFMATPLAASDQGGLDTTGLIPIGPAEEPEPAEDREIISADELEKRARSAERTDKAWEHWARCILGNLDKARNEAAVNVMTSACRILAGLR